MFFALWPDPLLRTALAGLARDVAHKARGRATAAGNLHLTLAFLGDQPERQVEVLRTLAQGVGGSSFALTLDEIGCFKRTGIAWLGASAPQRALLALQGRLAVALRQAGFSLDERPYAPHLTLARRARTPVHNALDRPISWKVTSFVLAASDLGPARPAYRIVDEWALDPA
jgi:2'-5' RNA ligase